MYTKKLAYVQRCAFFLYVRKERLSLHTLVCALLVSFTVSSQKRIWGERLVCGSKRLLCPVSSARCWSGRAVCRPRGAGGLSAFCDSGDGRSLHTPPVGPVHWPVAQGEGGRPVAVRAHHITVVLDSVPRWQRGQRATGPGQLFISESPSAKLLVQIWFRKYSFDVENKECKF